MFLGHTEAIKNSASLIISIKHTHSRFYEKRKQLSDVQPCGIVASCNTVHEVTELWS
jgi:hypothetical protein